MSQSISITDDLYRRLKVHASGFDTLSNVIETILNAYESSNPVAISSIAKNSVSTIKPSTNLEICYINSTKYGFKQALIANKKAYIKIYYSNGTHDLKKWTALKFNSSSNLEVNLRSGFLRDWKKRGIYKAELTINREEIA